MRRNMTASSGRTQAARREMNDPVTPGSPILRARMAGALYLINIAAGIFTEIFVRNRLIVTGDAAATAHNITQNGGLVPAWLLR